MDIAIDAQSAIRHDWTREEVRALFALPLPELIFRAQSVHRRHFDPRRGPALDAAVDQDRRLPRGLRLLPAKRPLRDRRRGREADGPRRRAGGGARAPKRPAPAASAWARPGASPRTAISTRSARWCEGVKASGARNLRHARHADRGAGAAAEVGRARLLQPQSRHLAGILRARSSPRAPIATGSTRSNACARRGLSSAAAASSAWAKAARTASA